MNFNERWLTHWAESVRGETLARLFQMRVAGEWNPEFGTTHLYKGDLGDWAFVDVFRQAKGDKVFVHVFVRDPENPALILIRDTRGSYPADGRPCYSSEGRPWSHLMVAGAFADAAIKAVRTAAHQSTAAYNKANAEDLLRPIGMEYIKSREGSPVDNMFLNS